jgi:hypothetical protein
VAMPQRPAQAASSTVPTEHQLPTLDIAPRPTQPVQGLGGGYATPTRQDRAGPCASPLAAATPRPAPGRSHHEADDGSPSLPSVASCAGHTAAPGASSRRMVETYQAHCRNECFDTIEGCVHRPCFGCPSLVIFYNHPSHTEHCILQCTLWPPAYLPTHHALPRLSLTARDRPWQVC